MEMELPPLESVEQKAKALESLISGPLASSASKLLSCYRSIPSGKDFHIYNNIDEFKPPAREGASKAESSLECTASSGIKMLSRDNKTTAARAKVPFHLPHIPKPQTEFNILVNNKNTPFEHVWLERSEDNSRFMHPLERLSVSDFVDRDIVEDKIKKPLSLESTPFKLVEGVKELKELATKLRAVNEFAVDLEHNQYRSFLGLTCLMQISTRTEDFIVDTLKLRTHIAPHLREVFKDPLKRKVMHGANHDILWLQRDFGIYVCNLFDTAQGSRLLHLERNSLEYLLRHFCDVEANKEYQNADWRLRPLPDEMIKYGREDTHYLLHIYDLMRCRLLSLSSNGNDLLLEVYKRSSEVCLQLYEKNFLTDTSYLHIYGLSEANFDSKQLAIVSGLYDWRDKVAREEDESTGYILPNKAVLEIARQMSLSSGNLCPLVKSRHPYIDRNLSVLSTIIKNALVNSSAFESIVEEMRKARVEAEKNENKVEQIKASVILPFYSFSSGENIPETSIPTEKNSVSPQIVQSPEQPLKTTTMEDVILLENNIDRSESPPENPKTVDGRNGDADTTETHASLSDLSSGFQQCSSQLIRKTNSLQENDRPPKFSPFSPFDYATARKTMQFGEETGKKDDGDMVDGGLRASRCAKKGFLWSGGVDERRERGQQPQRRQAFPPGNISAIGCCCKLCYAFCSFIA